MSLQGWHELACPECSGKDFVPAYRIIWQEGLGSSTRPVGHICAKCHKGVDQAKMVNHAKRLNAERKMKDLEAEIG